MNHFLLWPEQMHLAEEGMSGAIERARSYIEQGADGIFLRGCNISLMNIRMLKEALDVPLLANITEFGKTPLFTQDELEQVKVDMVLYPLTAFRAMSQSSGKNLHFSSQREDTRRSLGYNADPRRVIRILKLS